MIDPRALRTYLMVCRERSISAAARKLHVTQPAVSVTIGQLEQALGTSLFERSHSGIVLTAAGKTLMRRAESMESLLRDAEEAVELSKADIDGPLRIGGTPGALVSLVPDAVNRLCQRGGKFALHIVERPDNVLIELLRQGGIEVAVVTTGIGEVPDDIDEKALASDPFDLIVGKRNEHLPKQMSLRQTQEFRWVLPEAEGSFRRQLDALFVMAGVALPRNVVRCDSLLTTKAIVREGDYVTILPRRVAASELASRTLRAIRIREAKFNRDVGIRTRAGQPLSELAKHFVSALKPPSSA
jgi:DNA-binding transcriptional LysR family regulator